MPKASHPEDHALYEQLLEQTRDSEGVCHRNEAVKLLTESLAEKADRVTEYAAARASEVANAFDAGHQPEASDGQMAFDETSYLVIGNSERVAVKRATATHTRQWLDIQASNHARVAAAWAAKDQHGRKLLKIQQEEGCSMWEAEQILRSS